MPLDKKYNVRPIIIFTGGIRHFGEKAVAIKGGSLAERIRSCGMHTRCPVKYTVPSIPLMSYVAGILESVPGSLQHRPAGCSMLSSIGCDLTAIWRPYRVFRALTPPTSTNQRRCSTICPVVSNSMLPPCKDYFSCIRNEFFETRKLNSQI
jgi:hypothetical protein